MLSEDWDVNGPSKPEDLSSRALCRDCLTPQKLSANKSIPRCVSCRSPRLLAHDELHTLSIAHIDCDAFYASVEKRDNPELIDKPLIIGGGRRGVVSTACYIARINGVHSAQPMFKALEACPDAVVLPPNMEKYSRVGHQIREEMLSLTPLVEPISIDEAFLDLSGTERLHNASPAETLNAFAKHIQETIGITISIGLSFNKFLAKIASDFEKPRGFSVIGKEEALSFLEDKPVSMIWGVGKAFQKKLAADGITTIGQLQQMEETDLAKSYGVMGLRIAQLSKANDSRIVSPSRKTKSISSETTFNNDISSFDDLSRSLRALSEKVSAQLKKKQFSGHTVVLKLKTADFQTRTRNRKLTDPTQLADRIFRTSYDLLKKETDGTKFRLIGVGVSDLYPADIADPGDLIDEQSTKRAQAERAMDSVREKFGKNAVKHGQLFNDDTRPQREK
ncbi:MAG: DNA polymerase IV [Hyphomicrobiales bacterium]